MNLRKKLPPLSVLVLLSGFLLLNQHFQWFPTTAVTG